MKKHHQFLFRFYCFGLGMAFLLPAMVQGKFVHAGSAPVGRLLHSAEAYLAKHPEDAEAYYTLGRIHFLAFHLGVDQIPILSSNEAGGELPNIAPDSRILSGRSETPEIAPKDMADHAVDAMRYFKEALRLDSKNALYRLGLASLDEEIVTWREAQPSAARPPALQDVTLDETRRAYAEAMNLAVVDDANIKHRPLFGLTALTSYEAADALVRLAQTNPKTLKKAEQADVKRAKQIVEKCEQLPRGPMTPIVFSLQPVAHLSDLLASDTVVDFDLRGYGFREHWPWVKPSLGILVWDPQKAGHIISASQLFGGYTFQIFRNDGYDALAALDDNGDGVLKGSELDGLSVWFDRNGDGRASPDEVIPLAKLGVVALSVVATGHDGIHPMNSRGIVFKDGHSMPTWDWMVAPVKPEIDSLAGTGNH